MEDITFSLLGGFITFKIEVLLNITCIISENSISPNRLLVEIDKLLLQFGNANNQELPRQPERRTKLV